MKQDVEEIPNGLNVTLFYIRQKTGTQVGNVSDDVSNNVSDNPSPNQQKIINAIRVNEKITYAALSKLIGIAPTNIARNIRKLVEAKRITRVGSAKSGYWKIEN